MISNTERISTFIPEDTKVNLKKLAEERGLTMSAYIRMLIIDAVKQEKSKKK